MDSEIYSKKLLVPKKNISAFDLYFKCRNCSLFSELNIRTSFWFHVLHCSLLTFNGSVVAAEVYKVMQLNEVIYVSTEAIHHLVRNFSSSKLSGLQIYYKSTFIQEVNSSTLASFGSSMLFPPSVNNAFDKFNDLTMLSADLFSALRIHYPNQISEIKF